jgi:peptidoglycan-associated lipoprotein
LFKMRKLAVISLLGISLLMFAGCSRKKPATAVSPPLPEAPPPATQIESPESDAIASDPLAGDIESVNRHLRASGLLHDVYYEYDSAELSLEAKQVLAANARFLNEHPVFEVTVEGHCDERGTAEYNLALGERRASAAREYLTRLGVDGGRLRTLTFGEERPACTEPDEGCWSQNRRSQMVVSGRRGDS